MTLICSVSGGPDEGPAAEALAVPLTPSFLRELAARQRLVQDLAAQAGAAAALESVLFREPSPVWLAWTEELEDTLAAAEALGWTLTSRDLAAAPCVRTDGEVMQVWPERFLFCARLCSTPSVIRTAGLFFQDILAAAAPAVPAAEWRHAA